ncbi:MAG: 7-carboxy-7-deazaguanine synthase QueE [Candidatus Omnitrophica bacterium]|nr:7-carboxy-7-deazaguanine synthase QueE [Candidatus Omnitrophota bacterium]
MQHPPTSKTARISEIFSSLQGEGTLAGQRHLFIRFEECHIHCEYCDELHKKGRDFTLEEVLEQVNLLETTSGPHSFVSLTGGEPLLYVSFLKSLMPLLKAKGFRIYLETNGILGKALEEVIGGCDLIAMDIKLPSVTKEDNFIGEHEQFIKQAQTKELFVKIIVSKDLFFPEFEEALKLIEKYAPGSPVILQPVSNQREGHEDLELMDFLMEMQKRGMAIHRDLRILPRFHRILNLR